MTQTIKKLDIDKEDFVNKCSFFNLIPMKYTENNVFYKSVEVISQGGKFAAPTFKTTFEVMR